MANAAAYQDRLTALAEGLAALLREHEAGLPPDLVASTLLGNAVRWFGTAKMSEAQIIEQVRAYCASFDGSSPEDGEKVH